MTTGMGPANSQSPYLPPQQEFPEDPKVFREILAKRERLTADVLNIKENAQYERVELLTGQQWFTVNSSGALKSSSTFRLTFDLVSLNGGPIGPGATTLTLQTDPSVNTPIKINISTSIQPVHGFGGASNGTTFFFINDPLVFVRTNVWTNASQTITVTNNSGAPLTQCVWVFEYIKV